MNNAPARDGVGITVDTVYKSKQQHLLVKRDKNIILKFI